MAWFDTLNPGSIPLIHDFVLVHVLGVEDVPDCGACVLRDPM